MVGRKHGATMDIFPWKKTCGGPAKVACGGGEGPGWKSEKKCVCVGGGGWDVGSGCGSGGGRGSARPGGSPFEAEEGLGGVDAEGVRGALHGVPDVRPPRVGQLPLVVPQILQQLCAGLRQGAHPRQVPGEGTPRTGEGGGVP